MEIKGVTEDFSDRGSIAPWTPDGIQYTMEKIETIFEDCDAELTNAEMPTLGYEKQPINTMIEHMVILVRYVSSAHPQCYSELDHPLYVGFKNGAAETLSNIIMEDITTDNTFEMQKYEEVIDVNGHYYRSSTKKSLTMSDFLGLDAVIPGKGMPVVENVETIGWFTDLFRTDYERMGASVESLDQMLETYLHGGEYSHKEHHPIGNLVSGIFDVTIVKPFIESIYGYDLITGEKLTDFERGMQLVNAVVGAVTFGQGALAIDFAEMTGTEVAAVLLKTWAVDAVADVSAYTVGYACDELGMPAEVTFLASLATGCTVSVKAGKYVFQDANSNIVKELDADEMQTFLKELDVDLDDMTWGGGKGTYKIGTDTYFTWKLRGEDVTLNNVKVQEISYVKRSSAELQILRTDFNTTARKAFLEDLGQNAEYLRNAGFTETDILKIQNGRVPDGWQVHHKLPLDDSGTNSFENLVLIQNEPYHKVITNYQNSVVRQIKIGDVQKVQWPMPNGNIYPAKH